METYICQHKYMQLHSASLTLHQGCETTQGKAHVSTGFDTGRWSTEASKVFQKIRNWKA